VGFYPEDGGIRFLRNVGTYLQYVHGATFHTTVIFIPQSEPQIVHAVDTRFENLPVRFHREDELIRNVGIYLDVTRRHIQNDGTVLHRHVCHIARNVERD
jgi:hypothetical protein